MKFRISVQAEPRWTNLWHPRVHTLTKDGITDFREVQAVAEECRKVFARVLVEEVDT